MAGIVRDWGGGEEEGGGGRRGSRVDISGVLSWSVAVIISFLPAWSRCKTRRVFGLIRGL